MTLNGLALSFHTQALLDICLRISKALNMGQGSAKSAVSTKKGAVSEAGREKPFDTMNNIVANLLLNLTG